MRDDSGGIVVSGSKALSPAVSLTWPRALFLLQEILFECHLGEKVLHALGIFHFLGQRQAKSLFPWSETSRILSWARPVLGSQGRRRRTGPDVRHQIATASPPSPFTPPAVPGFVRGPHQPGSKRVFFSLCPSSVHLQGSMKRARL